MIYNYMRGEVERGGEINCYCPICQPNTDEKDKRLYYKKDGDNILLHCKHGCSFDDIIKFFPKSNKKTAWVLLREHIYHNPDGSIFGKKCYYLIEGKKQPIWQRYEDNQYITGLNGKKADLYNVCELINADENKTVWIVEGEKDADNMKKHGFLAVSPPNGAGYWTQHFNKYFRKKNVVIIPDNDEAGRKHLEKVCKNLLKFAKTVKLIDLTDIVPDLKKGGDVSDIFDIVPNTESELLRLSAETSSEQTRNADICYVLDYNGKPLKTFSNFKLMIDYCGVKISYNSMKGIEFDGNLPKVSEENKEEVIYSYLYDKSRETEINFSDTEIFKYTMSEADKNYYNPVADWITALDKNKRGYVRQYFDCLVFSVDEEQHKERYFALFVKWLLQCAAMVFNSAKEPYGADGALGLQSEREGIGKTTFFRRLSPDPNWFKDGMHVDPSDKDTVITATNYWICELGEVESSYKKDLERLKAFITSEKNEYRIQYARGNTKKPRRTSFCFTCNSDKFLQPGDNRRFWTIPITGINLEVLTGIDINSLWGEIYGYYEKKPQGFRLTTEEIKFLAENNREKFSVISNEETVLRDKFNFDLELNNPVSNSSQWSYMSSSDISFILFGDKRYAANIGKSMIRKLGYVKDSTQKKHYRIYCGKTEYFVPFVIKQNGIPPTNPP